MPTHFEDFKKVNQHQTSTIIKYYLTERGFPAVYDTEQPTEIKINPCEAAYVKLRDDSGMFMTRVVIRFVDCEGKLLFETREGTSKEKDYAASYKEAIAEAFQTFAGMAYAYSGQPSGDSARQPVADNSREEMARGLQVAREAIPERRESPVSVSVPDDDSTGAGELLYAQEIENGYQLVDSTPKVRMKLMRTSQADRFIALVDGQTRGMVYQQGTQWVHEYYDAGTLHTDELRIKF